jgi:two-component system KDP operon response regulator KdpE
MANTGIKGKVLIVGDETAIRRAWRNTLERVNFEISEAATGEQAIARLGAAHFYAVLLDFEMPGMNGIESCRRIRHLAPLVGIVMLTIRNTEEEKSRRSTRGRTTTSPNVLNYEMCHF